MAKYSKITEESTPEVTSRSINIFLVILKLSIVNVLTFLKKITVYFYASVGGATGHTVVVLCMYVCTCLSVGRISRRSLKTKR